MKKFLLPIVILSAGTAFAAVTNQVTGLNLIPWPAQIEQRAGQFVLTEQTVIATDAAFKAEAAQLAKDLSVRTGESRAGIALMRTLDG